MIPVRNLAVIGGGINSVVGRAHYAASHVDALFRWKNGLFSRDHDRNYESAMKYCGNPLPYVDMDDLLQDQDDDSAVLILTPTPNHAEEVIQCLNAGMPVICEKSLACSVDEIKSIPDNGFLAVTYNYTGYPMLRELKRIIQDGQLGRLLHFEAEMPQEGYLRDGSVPQQWRRHDGYIPMIYLDLGVHLHQIVHYLTGLRPESVIASHASDSSIRVIDDVTALSIYETGVRGRFWFGKTSLGHRNGLRIAIHGSKGSAQWGQSNPEQLQLAFNDGILATLDRGSSLCEVASEPRYQRFKAGHPAGYVEAMGNLYYDIFYCLRDYQNTGNWRSNEVFGKELALQGLQFMEAMVRSTETKQWHIVQ